jgi:WD40 repeat protein
VSPPHEERIDFTLERQRHRRFVGREDVLARLDAWLLGANDTGWVVITGGPGMGKSAILSRWLDHREAAGAAVPHHFVRRQVIDWDQPERIAASLAAQIEAIFPEQRDARAKPEGRLPELLGRVSQRLGASGRLVIVIDGLDETRAEPGENPLPRFLPHAVPAGIRILCATRPTYPLLGWIEARSPSRRVNLDDNQWASSNEAVVRGFWEAVEPDYHPPLPAATVAAAIARAGGNVLHAVMLHDVLRDAPAEQRRAERIPGGLKHLIGEAWDRAASTESVRVGLGLLCAAQQAISLDMLAESAAWSYDDKERFVREARQLLLEEPASWAGATAYRPRHDWVRELMAERLGGPTICAHHETLARTLGRWPSIAGPVARRYALRHALIHRAEAGAWADAWHLAADMSFLEARCRELGAHEAEADAARIAERCRASGNEALRERFVDLTWALGRESHWLRAAPEATAAVVWNRLRQLGWSEDELDQQLQVPNDARFLRLRYVASRESAALVRDLVGHAGRVTACAITPDGRWLVSASDDNMLKVWDLASGRAQTTLQGHADRVTACAVTPDGQQVISASADNTLKVWDLASGRARATLQGHADTVTACAVTPDGRHVVSASADRTLKVWDLASGRAQATLEGHSHVVTACAVTPDGRSLVSASRDQTLKMWDLASGRAQTTLQGHADWVTACAVTPDGQRLVSASHDKTLKVWDLASGRAEATLVGHAYVVTACAVTSDGQHVVSASRDKTLKVWNLASGRAVATLQGHTNWVTACVAMPDGRQLVSASRDHTLKVWDLMSQRAEAPLQGHTDWVTACAVTPDGQYVVSASDDQTLKVWNLAGGRTEAILQGHAHWVTACAATPDGRRVISASWDRTLKVWDLASGRTETTLQGHTDWVTACAVTPDGRHVISASRDRTLKIWDLASGRAEATLQGHADWVTACAVTPDGQHLISASYDRTLKVWDLTSRRAEVTLQGHTNTVTACAVTPDGQRVVSASEDNTLMVWDLASGRAEATLEGHSHVVTACAVTSDGRRMVSASLDNTLKVWNLQTGACLLTHRGNVGYLAIAVSPTAIIAGDTAGAVWFLDWPPPDARQGSAPEVRHSQPSPPSPPESSAQRPPMKHTILFMAANPLGTDHLALDREARAIQAELERSGFRDRFDFVTRWAVEPLDLLRELRKLKPTVVHFSGHGTAGAAARDPGPEPHRDLDTAAGPNGRASRSGLFVQDRDGGPQLVSTEALEALFGAIGSSVKVVVLSACYSDSNALALLRHVDCVIGMTGAISDEAARSFAIGFYGGIGEREPIGAAYAQGRVAISLQGLAESDRPKLAVRSGVDAGTLILATDAVDVAARPR